MNKAKPVKLKIDWATHEAAKFACKHWHYSKTVPAGALVKIGAWENDKFIGVVLFSRGATPNLCKPYGLTQMECCELTRIALTSHQSPVTRIMSIAIKFFKERNPGMKLIVSFADTDQGHHGGIYQGGNWIYSGSAKLDSWVINGEKIHPRSVVMKYGSRSLKTVLNIDSKAKKHWGLKHRYLFPLDEKIKQQVLKLSKPYPKRASSVESGTLSFQDKGGGESPTDALQLEGSHD